jgi:hypothetical protein
VWVRMPSRLHQTCESIHLVARRLQSILPFWVARHQPREHTDAGWRHGGGQANAVRQ